MAETTEVTFDTQETPPPPDTSPDNVTPPTEGERPTWLPEKFSSAEEMAKAYGELEGKLGSAVSSQDNPAQIIKTEEPAAPAFNVEKYTSEMIRDGSLSEDSMKELAKAGLPENIIATHVQGLEAIRDQQVAKLHEISGGQERFQQMATWAAASLPQDQVDAFNAAIQTGDGAQTELAMRGLVAQFEQSAASGGTVVDGGTGVDGGYESTAEMLVDMGKPEYETDEAFRQRVWDKAGRSGVARTRIK